MAKQKATPVQINNPYKFSVYQTSAQTLTANVETKVRLDTELFDSNNNFDSTTNWRYTAPVSGFYQFNAEVSINSGSPVTRLFLSLAKNGADVARGSDGQSIAASGSVLLQLTAGDYIELNAFCSSTIATLAYPSNFTTYMNGYLVSAT